MSDDMIKDILDDIKALLDLTGTAEFDIDLKLYIKSAVSFLKNAGVEERRKEEESYELYTICIAHWVKSQFDMDTPDVKLSKIFDIILLQLKVGVIDEK